MEAILSMVGIVIAWVVISSIIRAVASAGKRTVKKVVTGRDTYFGPPQLKVVDEKVEKLDVALKRIMFRGLLPNDQEMELGYIVSAFDSTGEELEVVISLLEQSQEPDTIAFQVVGDMGCIGGGLSITDWVQMGAIAPEFIQTPRSGTREITLVVRIYDMRNPPSIHVGFGGSDESLWMGTVKFEYTFTEKGYQEEAEHREEAESISLKIGMAVAMADGVLDDEEGEVLKAWILKSVSPYSDEKQAYLKKLYNSSMREAFAAAQAGTLALTPLVERLAEIGDKKSKYDAVELGMDIMVADGVADPEEMIVIRRVAEALDLDMGEIEKMREHVTLDLVAHVSGEAGLESLVGLEKSWSDEQKRKHLRTEFQKWSNRLNSLQEGGDRDSAQAMLENIAMLRKKYG